MRGRPAFGLIQSGRPGAAAVELGDDRRHVLEARPAVGADGRGALLEGEGDDLGGRRAHHRARAAVERERQHEREIGRAAHAVDGGSGLDLAEHRLEQEQVDAAVCERLGLLGIGVGRLVVRERAERLAQLAGGAERSGHEDVGADGLARQLGRAAVELACALGQRSVREADARAAERAGQDDVGARLREAAVQLDDAIGVGEHPFLGRDADREAHALAGRAGRAVGDQHIAAREALEKADACSRGIHAELLSPDIQPGIGTLPRRQVAEASTGRDPQPLLMLSELTLASNRRLSAAKAADRRQVACPQLVVEHALAFALGQAEHAHLAEVRVVVHVVAGLPGFGQRVAAAEDRVGAARRGRARWRPSPRGSWRGASPRSSSRTSTDSGCRTRA